MNCGLPVVATDVGGTAEAVLDGETGILVSASNADGLVTAVERLVGDADLRQRMGIRGLRHAEAEFDPERHSEALARELRALVERP
jgi:glycosyltransferase involved in cell wall biosynthesis